MSDLPIPPDLKARLDALSSAELALVAGYAWAKSHLKLNRFKAFFSNLLFFYSDIEYIRF